MCQVLCCLCSVVVEPIVRTHEMIAEYDSIMCLMKQSKVRSTYLMSAPTC